MEFASGTRIGRFTILKKLGEGAQGAVFEAKEDEWDRRVALKLLDGGRASMEERRRFVQEAKLICRVEHPGIVTLYESGEISEPMGRFDKLIYISMQRLRGDTLAGFIAQHRNGVDPKIACELGWQMADALGAAHAERVIHRDLKPANVFLVDDRATYLHKRIKILDFGLGKHLGSSQSAVDTHVAAVGGTPVYMSPEQWSSIAAVDHRTDIYALGCILFELLTGRTPFIGITLDDLKHHHLHTPPPPLDADTVGQDVCDLVQAMLAKNPAERVQQMEHVIAALHTARMRPSRAHIPVAVAPAPETSDPLLAPTIAPAVAPTMIGVGTPAPKPQHHAQAGAAAQQHIAVDRIVDEPPPQMPDDTLPGVPPGVIGTQPASRSRDSDSEPVELATHRWPAASVNPPAVPEPPSPPVQTRAMSLDESWDEWQSRVASDESAARRRRIRWIAALAIGCGIGFGAFEGVRYWMDSSPTHGDEGAKVGPTEKREDVVTPDPPSARPAKDPSPPSAAFYGVPIGSSYVDGPADAPVTMIVASEYGCPHCEAMRPVLADLRAKYAHDLRIVHEQFVVHPTVTTASALAICAAAKQNAYAELDPYLWDKGYKLRTFDAASCWTEPAGCPIVVGFARAAGLDVPRFRADMRACESEVNATQADLAAFGVRGVPAYFINGRPLVGRMPVEQLASVIDDELTRFTARTAEGASRETYYEEWVVQRGLKAPAIEVK